MDELGSQRLLTLDVYKRQLYNDTKKYYDALKQVNNLIGDAYKVKECILMVADISEIYVGFDIVTEGVGVRHLRLHERLTRIEYIRE